MTLSDLNEPGPHRPLTVMRMALGLVIERFTPQRRFTILVHLDHKVGASMPLFTGHGSVPRKERGETTL